MCLTGVGNNISLILNCRSLEKKESNGNDTNQSRSAKFQIANSKLGFSKASPITSLWTSTGTSLTWAATCTVERRRRRCWGNVYPRPREVARGHFRMRPQSVNKALSKQAPSALQPLPARISESTGQHPDDPSQLWPVCHFPSLTRSKLLAWRMMTELFVIRQ